MQFSGILPASFGNDAGLFAYSLASIITISCLTSIVFCWMSKEIWEDRNFVHPVSGLMAYRCMVLFAAFTGMLRTIPEAIYMLAWNEVDVPTMELILLGKRIADSVAFFPGVSWVVLMTLSYPTIALELKSQEPDVLRTMSPWYNLIRPLLALLLIFIIAVLVATGKVYLGTQIYAQP